MAICLKAYPDTNHAWTNLLRAAKIKVKGSGQECPLYTVHLHGERTAGSSAPPSPSLRSGSGSGRNDKKRGASLNYDRRLRARSIVV